MTATPLLDKWRARLKRELGGYGRKAELARHLAKRYGREQRSWEQTIQNILNRQAPNGEVLLAINEWLARQK